MVCSVATVAPSATAEALGARVKIAEWRPVGRPCCAGNEWPALGVRIRSWQRGTAGVHADGCASLEPLTSAPPPGINIEVLQ